MGSKILPMASRILLFLSLFWLQGCASQSRLVEGKLATVNREALQYYLYYPEGYFSSQGDDFGLMLFLHGGGESGSTLDSLKVNGPPKLLAEGKQFPFLVLAPQNPQPKKWWNTHAVMELLDSVVEQTGVDPNRIYLSGLSRGGSAAWTLATQYPEKFAALAVVCGMAPVPYAHWVDKELPIWVFHGDSDPVIDVGEADRMVAKLKEMGYDVRYSRYKGVGHNAWTRAYTTDSLYTWMDGQRRMD